MTDHDSFTEDEVANFANKLHDWGGSLPDREQALLRSLLIEAEAGSEVEGFGRQLPGDQFSKANSLPTLRDSAFNSLKPMVELENPWILSAYADTWRPT